MARGDRARRRARDRVALALGASVLLHVVVAALAAPAARPPVSEPPVEQVVEVVALPAGPAPPASTVAPEPTPEVPPRSEVPSRADAPPLLAAAVRPEPPASRIDATATFEPTPAPEPTPGEAATVPTPRELARRAVAEGAPRPPSPEEDFEGRLDAMLAGALRPLPNDVSADPELREDRDGNLVYRHRGLRATIRPDGTVGFGTVHGLAAEGFGDCGDETLRQHTRLPGVPLAVVRGGPDCSGALGAGTESVTPGVTFRPNFDLNDLAAAIVGDDPLAAQKRWFLRQTEELRDSLASKTRKRVTTLAPAAALRQAEAVLRDGSLSYAAKRRVLFELWDEAEEAASPEDDRPEAAAGLRAREWIEALVRRRLPSGSEHAFSEDELRRFDTFRASRRRFRPYGP